MADARKNLPAAAVLTALAGYVDATGYLVTGGFFPSFMSGNSTRAGIGLAEQSSAATIALMLIGSFVLGVIAGTVLRIISRKHIASLLLIGIAACLSVSQLLFDHDWKMLGVAIIAFGMGAENLVFERDGEVRFGITYMTGTLVKIGQHIGRALGGGPRWDWLHYAALWIAMLAGGASGALIYAHWSLDALWGPVAVLLILAFVLRHHDEQDESGETDR